MIAAGLIATKGADAGTVPAGSLAALPQNLAAPVPHATGTTPSASPFPPTAPTNLVVTAVTSHSISLSWTASSPGCCEITGYTIGYPLVFSDVGQYSEPVGNVTSATLTYGVSPKAQYRISVSAVDSLGNFSPSSSTIMVVTPASDSGPDVNPPSAPTNLGYASGGGTILTCSPSTDDVAVIGYDVYRWDGLYAPVLLGTATGTTFPMPVPTNSTPHDIAFVRARDAAGNVSIASNTVPFRPGSPSPPPPPTSPTPPPAPTCTMTYTTLSQWTGGFAASVKVVNSGPATIIGWGLTFAFGGDQRITSAWSARFTQSGAAVTLRNTDWNTVIRPHGSVSMGMIGNWTASDTPPPAFALNGVACAAG